MALFSAIDSDLLAASTITGRRAVYSLNGHVEIVVLRLALDACRCESAL